MTASLPSTYNVLERLTELNRLHGFYYANKQRKNKKQTNKKTNEERKKEIITSQTDCMALIALCQKDLLGRSNYSASILLLPKKKGIIELD